MTAHNLKAEMYVGYSINKSKRNMNILYSKDLQFRSTNYNLENQHVTPEPEY